jgi:hypothetical protein
MAGISGGAGEAHPTSAEFISLQAQVSAISVLAGAGGESAPTSAQYYSLIANQATKAVLKSSQVISVSALANVSGMGFSVGAGHYYAFTYKIIYQSASPSSGLGLTVTFPGMTNIAAQVNIPQGPNPGTAHLFSGTIGASGTRIQAISTPVSTQDFYAEVLGACKVSTSGTLQLQAAPEVSGAANQIVIREGTMGAIWPTD